MNLGLKSYNPPPRPDVSTAAARLAELDVFPGASKTDLKKIALTGHLVTVPAGWTLMAESTPADKAYVVLRGQVAVKHGQDEFARLGEGELVGEMAIVHRHLRNATAVAATDLEALHLTKEAVEQLCESVPAFRAVVERTATDRAAA